MLMFVNFIFSSSNCEESEPRMDQLTKSGGVMSASLIRAEELHLNLKSGYPWFVMSILRSHVLGFFWDGKFSGTALILVEIY